MPVKKVRKRANNRSSKKKGVRLLTPDEVRRLLVATRWLSPWLEEFVQEKKGWS